MKRSGKWSGWGGRQEEPGVVTRLVARVRDFVAGEVIRAGKTGYGSGTGWWLGMGDDGVPRLDLGAAAHYLRWDGAELVVKGEVTADTGSIGGWTIGLKRLDSKNGYVSLVADSDQDYGEGVTLLQAGWLASGGVRWLDAGGRMTAILVANDNGSGDTALKLLAYPREGASSPNSSLDLIVSDAPYGQAGGRLWGLSVSSGGVVGTAARLDVGGGLDAVQLKVTANPDGQTANLAEFYLADESVGLAVGADGCLAIGGQQVVGARQAAIAGLADTGGAANDGACRAAVNAILAALRAHGLIAG